VRNNMREIKFRAWDTENKCMRNNVAVGLGMVEYDLSCHQPVEIMIPMQFTGLFDKNGKEIYEGDILKIGNSNIEVIWDKNNAWFTLKSNHFHLGFQSIFYEVIGNIYEHPNLLESEEK